MSKYKCQATCPGCESKTEISFKKPSLFSPTVVSFNCSECGSQVQIKLKKLPKSPMGQVNVQPLNIRPSQMLLDMKKEEAEHNAKSVEEQGQP